MPQTTNFKMKAMKRFGMMKHNYYSLSSVYIFTTYLKNTHTWPCEIIPYENQPRFRSVFSTVKAEEVQGVGRVRGEKRPVLADAPRRKNHVERMVKRCGPGFWE